MRIGVDLTDITPAGAVSLGGYAARQGPSVGVHDPLTARTLVLEAGGRRLALVAADLLMFTRAQTERIRARAAVLSGMAPEGIIVAATHTHAGPLPFDDPHLGGRADAAYVAWLEEELARSVARAAGQLKPACFGWAAAPVRGVGAVRRAVTPPENDDPAAARDAGNVSVVAFSDPEGRLAAVLLHYACHPTVMGAENRLITADLIGAARAALERKLGGDVPVVAVNGACGDVSTRFTRRAQTFAELERLGGVLADAAFAALQRVKCMDVHPEACLSATAKVALPLRQLPALEGAVAALQDAAAAWSALQMRVDNGEAVDHGRLRLARTALEGAQAQVELARLAAGGSGAVLESEADLTAWLLGNFGLVTIPGELFSSLGEAITAESGLDTCLTIGYAGGMVGYIPAPEDFAAGGYEVLSTHLAPEAGAVLVKRAAGLLRDLARRQVG